MAIGFFEGACHFYEIRIKNKECTIITDDILRFIATPNFNLKTINGTENDMGFISKIKDKTLRLDENNIFDKPTKIINLYNLAYEIVKTENNSILFFVNLFSCTYFINIYKDV